jgi:predicted GNAT family acetyltransferase
MPCLRRFTDVREFAQQVTPFLSEQEAGNSLPFRILGALAAKSGPLPAGAYLAACLENDRSEARVLGVALRTPPHNLVLSSPCPADALAALVADTGGTHLPGVIGPLDEAERFAAHWKANTRGTTAVTMRLGTYALEQLIAAPAVPGRLRAAQPDDASLAGEWMRAFYAEALPHAPPPPEPADLQGYYFWETDAGPVTAVRAKPATPRGAVINDVYTPPIRRRRGYATAAVAAASSAMFADGWRICFLFTDLANPTSNSIYQRIGYRFIGEFRQIGFTPAATG